MALNVDDPDELHALAFVAMQHALGSIETSGPLVPFAITDGDDGRKFMRFMAERLEDMQAHGRQLLAENPPSERAALAWDGYIHHEGGRVDAIFIEAYESGAAGGILIAQPYQSKGLLRKRNEAVGQATIVERGRPPLF
jgi:hypothetical protein